MKTDAPRPTSALRRVVQGLRRVFTVDLPLKLLAAVLTVILYFLVQQDAINEFSLSVPVVLSSKPQNSIFVGDLPDELRVRVRGRWSRILDMLERKPEPFPVDLAETQNGDVLRFRADDVQRHLGQSGLEVVSVDPPQMTVKLDRFLSRLVPVTPVLVGEPAEGYEVDHTLVQVRPQSVWVEGPYDAVTALREVRTTAIDVSNLQKDLRTEVQLERPRPRFVELQSDRVTAEIPLHERMYEATFSGLTMRVVPCPPGYACHVEPPTFEVRVLGKYFTVAKLEPDALTGLVSVRREALPGEVGTWEAVKPEVDSPPEFIMQVKPDSFRVIIEKSRDEAARDAAAN
jgi:hypothetical protein